MGTITYWILLLTASILFAVTMYRLRRKYDEGNDQTSKLARFFYGLGVAASIFGPWFITGVLVQTVWPFVETGALHFLQNGIWL